jgi:hypothetical protein
MTNFKISHKILNGITTEILSNVNNQYENMITIKTLEITHTDTHRTIESTLSEILDGQ